MKNNDCLYLIMPAYNEQENIQSVVNQWYVVVESIGGDSRLVVLNDGSKDNTALMLKELCTRFPRLITIDKPNSGHGATLLYGYRYAIEREADYVFQTDSDGQTNPEEFWTFWENRSLYDFQIGNRKIRMDGFGRVIVSKVLMMVIFSIFGVWVKDANTPYRLMQTDKLAEVMKFIPENFFLTNVAVSAIAVKKKQKVAWHFITFKPRQGGVNSINFKRIIKIGWQAVGDFYSIKRKL